MGILTKQISIKTLFIWTTAIVFIVTTLCIVNNNILSMLQVYGNSMYPTLHDGEYVLLLKAYSEPKTGDIIAFTDLDSGLLFCKRIIGTEGDFIEVESPSTVKVNNKELTEIYLNEGAIYTESISIEVPKNNVFVLGDNRNSSKDSRYFGCINKCNIKGKVINLK